MAHSHPDTLLGFDRILLRCQHLFAQKHQDYGSAWRILRLPSLTDQIFIKARRIRAIQEKGIQKVADEVSGEFIGIINYSLMALMQMGWQNHPLLDLPWEEIEAAYVLQVAQIRTLLANKNHDYGEAWRDMRVSSMTDQILMKLLRIKQIEDHQGQTLVSEGVQSIYQDIVNYAVFCLIKTEECSDEMDQS
ncbi:MAG: DUF1599 domain-containing protein [Microscillaceae bacterium]|nr:DUF1599 domain-containing protein [Microscillaceae bacterium]